MVDFLGIGVSVGTVVLGIVLADQLLIKRTAKRAIKGLKESPEYKNFMEKIEPHIAGVSDLLNSPEFENFVAKGIKTINALPALVEKADRVLSIFDINAPALVQGEKEKVVKNG